MQPRDSTLYGWLQPGYVSCIVLSRSLAHFFFGASGKSPDSFTTFGQPFVHVFRFERPFSASSGLAIYFTSAYRRIVAVTSEQWFQDAL